MLSASVFLLHRAFVLIFPYRTLPKREPSVSPPATLEPDALVCSKRIDAIEDEGQLEKQFDHWLAFLREEDERRKSIDARLTSIIGLSSVAATVVFGTLVALASGSVRINEPILQRFIAALAAFLTLQLGLAIRAAIQGLGMRTYLSIDIPHMIQTSAETSSDYLKRRFKWSVEELVDHTKHNDEKILWMNVALAALRNFIISLMVMALCMSLYIGTTSEPPQNAQEEVSVRNGTGNQVPLESAKRAGFVSLVANHGWCHRSWTIGRENESFPTFPSCFMSSTRSASHFEQDVAEIEALQKRTR